MNRNMNKKLHNLQKKSQTLRINPHKNKLQKISHKK